MMMITHASGFVNDGVKLVDDGVKLVDDATELSPLEGSKSDSRFYH